MEFIIHGKTITLNQYVNSERTNRFMAAKIKREEMERICWQLPNVKIEGRNDYSFTFYDDNKRTDPDNYLLFAKFWMDALVKKGIIENDGRKQVGKMSFEMKEGTPRVEILAMKSKQ